MKRGKTDCYNFFEESAGTVAIVDPDMKRLSTGKWMKVAQVCQMNGNETVWEDNLKRRLVSLPTNSISLLVQPPFHSIPYLARFGTRNLTILKLDKIFVL
ncbi:hypothetical protein M758_2G126100 [Ceratodon purpureus]|nr:hypothetical protein M758_2G126100 [Ceratodon purpureus]